MTAHAHVAPLTHTDCINHGLDPLKPCSGEVLYRMSLSGTGTPIPRCDFHWEARLEWQEQHNLIYPDSNMPPSWFDAEAAGERWNDDD